MAQMVQCKVLAQSSVPQKKKNEKLKHQKSGVVAFLATDLPTTPPWLCRLQSPQLRALSRPQGHTPQCRPQFSRRLGTAGRRPGHCKSRHGIPNMSDVIPLGHCQVQSLALACRQDGRGLLFCRLGRWSQELLLTGAWETHQACVTYLIVID
jgi:hypothetical protein